jgi:hypothetical protein
MEKWRNTIAALKALVSMALLIGMVLVMPWIIENNLVVPLIVFCVVGVLGLSFSMDRNEQAKKGDSDNERNE